MSESSRNEYIKASQKRSSEGKDWIERLKAEREEKDEEAERRANIFCAQPLGTLLKMNQARSDERIRREMDQNPEQRKKLEEFHTIIWDQTKDKLKLAAEVAEEDLKALFVEYLKEVKNVDEVVKKINFDNENEAGEIENETSINDIADALVEKCAKNTIEDELLPIIEAALRKYQEEMLEKEEEARKDMPKMVKKFEKLLEAAIKKGLFPIDPSIIKERIKNLKILLMDPLTSKLLKVDGEFRAEPHTLTISLAVIKDKNPVSLGHKFFHFISDTITDDDKYTLETLGHEILHGISGQSGNPEITRVGMKFKKDKKRQSPDKILPSFNWLNEALTEQATMDLLEKTDGTIYHPERELLKMMIQNGISRDSLYKAYFDNYTIKKGFLGKEKKGAHRTPDLKNLFEETNNKFGKAFLVNLDRYITMISLESNDEKMGLYQAMEAWKLEKENFPQYLEQWHQERREGIQK